MTTPKLWNSHYWTSHFGLAHTPLFENDHGNVSGDHSVLLDGGFGSFVLSVTDERIWEDRTTAGWCWSSNIPHQVTVTDNEVAVVRWDKLRPELLTRRSVERQLHQFYRYLAADRIESNQSVTDHMLRVFRGVRSLVADARIADDRSIDAFLALLGHAIERNGNSNPIHVVGAHPQSDSRDLLPSLSRSGVNQLLEHLVSPTSELQLAFLPSLAIRHAGSEIFQEAHFELLRTSIPDMFGYAAPATSKPVTRRGTHYTPPPLARAIAERTLAEVPDLKERDVLTVLDPACGSGSFLLEALRTLRRLDYRGKVILVGRDISAPAISMATFVLGAAIADWTPTQGCEIDIRQADSLGPGLPTADVVLMNPPFVAWPAMTTAQREQMREVLGPQMRGRADLSMAFVSRALESVSPNGALGTLLPGSLLTMQAAERWRRYIMEHVDLTFIASLGDYGLFKYAQVQVAAVVLVKGLSRRRGGAGVDALVASNDRAATGDALRALRGVGRGRDPEVGGKRVWSLFQISRERLRRRGTWRLISSETEEALDTLLAFGRAVRIGDIFNVRQGVRTGASDTFILTAHEIARLPAREQKWFRPAVVNASVRDGVIRDTHGVFYPYTTEGPAMTREEDLCRLVPQYFDQYLQLAQEKLKRRASIVRAKREDWWGLDRRRGWALDRGPRIVSKYFGGPGGFAGDLLAQYVIVQGFAWLPKWSASAEEPPVEDVLAGYIAVMNSAPFMRLLTLFSPHVAGGQFDLSPRYVKEIPIPDLRALSRDERDGESVRQLATLGLRPQCGTRDWQRKVDVLTTELIGGEVFGQASEYGDTA